MMYITGYVFLTLALLTNVIQCPGGGGGGGDGGGGGGGGRFYGGSFGGRPSKPCSTPEECRRERYVLVGFMGFIYSFGLMYCLCMCYLCYDMCSWKCCSRSTGIPKQNNWVFISQKSTKKCQDQSHPFETGMWSSRYKQYRRWHGPYELFLSFNHSTNYVTGHGTDNVGDFAVGGSFSSENLRLGLHQYYKLGTGDPTENLGHVSITQLEWNSHKKEFDGKWYVKTSKYSGNGDFKLSFKESSIPLLDAGLEC